MKLPPALKEKVFSQVSSQRSRTRSGERLRRTAWLTLALGMVISVVAIRGIAPTNLERPLSYVLVSVGTMLLCALGATTWVLTSGGDSLGRPHESLRALAAFVPLAITIGVLAASAAAPVTATVAGLSFSAHLTCASTYIAVGSLLLGILLLGLRPIDAVGPATKGAAVGAAVGAWTSVVMSLVCASPERTHVLVAHVSPLLLFVAMGALLGRRLLTYRYRSRRAPSGP
jgi:hypothetical protein